MTRRFLITLALIGGFAGVGAALAQTVDGLDLDAIRARAAAHSDDAVTLSAEVARRIEEYRPDAAALEAAARQKYDKAITFEFSHFMSPQSAYLQAGHLYDRYKEYFEIG